MNTKLPAPFTAAPLSAAITISLISATLALANQGNTRPHNAATQTTEAAPKAEPTAEPITQAAISAAIEEYARSRYAGDVQAVRDRLHPAVASRTLADTYWGQPSDEWVRPMTYEGTAHLATSANRARRDDPQTGRCEITIHDIAQRTAAATLVSEDRVEMLHMIHFEGRWIIADIVTDFLDEPGDRPPAKSSRHAEAITELLTDYCVGFYEIDGQKVQDTCHPILSKRVVEHNDEADFDHLRQITFEEIEILGETFNKSFGFNPDTARCDVDVYEIRGNMAIAKMTGAIWFDYFQLLKVDNQWQIINIMFEGLPRNQWEEA